jgi:hypothetical protein
MFSIPLGLDLRLRPAVPWGQASSRGTVAPRNTDPAGTPLSPSRLVSPARCKAADHPGDPCVLRAGGARRGRREHSVFDVLQERFEASARRWSRWGGPGNSSAGPDSVPSIARLEPGRWAPSTSVLVGEALQAVVQGREPALKAMAGASSSSARERLRRSCAAGRRQPILSEGGDQTAGLAAGF